VALLMDWMHSGSLQNVLDRTRHRMHEKLIRRYLVQALRALEGLHQLKYLHGGVRPSNFMLSGVGGSFWLLKLSDPGLNECFGDPSNPLPADVPYLAPEVARDPAARSPASDMYALAATMLHLATGEVPWSDTVGPAPLAVLKFLRGLTADTYKAPVLPPTLSSAYREMLSPCFAFAPSERPSATALLRHPYITNVGHLPDDAETAEAFELAIAETVEALNRQPSMGTPAASGDLCATGSHTFTNSFALGITMGSY